MANILYRKQKQQKSLDNGVTWIDTGEYRVGDIIENPSNCTSENTKQCRWVELLEGEGYYCDGYSKYTMQVEECTENGLIWTRTGNSQRGNTFIESNSTDCGYVKPDTPTGDTTNDTLSFEFTGDTTTYELNGTTYTATSSPYSTSLADLGINTLTNCYDTFSDSSITKLISFPDTSNVTTMIYMFANCESLTSLDLSSFNTSNVTDMNRMFGTCENLTSLDLSSFNTSNVTKMRQMFYYCESLTSLDLSNFNTSNVTDMNGMFYGCGKLTSLDVSSFDISKVTNSQYMFYYCTSLQTLKIKQGTRDWWYDKLTKASIQNNVTIIEV